MIIKFTTMNSLFLIQPLSVSLPPLIHRHSFDEIGNEQFMLECGEFSSVLPEEFPLATKTKVRLGDKESRLHTESIREASRSPGHNVGSIEIPPTIVPRMAAPEATASSGTHRHGEVLLKVSLTLPRQGREGAGKGGGDSEGQ
jgi:hypothetical protein